MQWEEGDSSYDKVRVWGESPRATIRVYRYESPGPFELTIVVQRSGDEDVEQVYRALRDKVLTALNASVWKRLEPQPVALVKVFPAAYEFDCDRTMDEMKRTLDNADFWWWETVLRGSQGICREGRIAFQRAGRPIGNSKQRVVIRGERPSYSIEIGHWQDELDRTPSCDQVHEIVQTMILPAIGAHRVRAASQVSS